MKEGLKRYSNKNETIKYRKGFNDVNYQKFIFYLNKKTDKKMIDYFMKADNKTQALRDLFRKS